MSIDLDPEFNEKVGKVRRKNIDIKVRKKKHVLIFVRPFFHGPYHIWPLAGPNIAREGWPLQTLARDDRQENFGTFDF